MGGLGVGIGLPKLIGILKKLARTLHSLGGLGGVGVGLWVPLQQVAHHNTPLRSSTLVGVAQQPQREHLAMGLRCRLGSGSSTEPVGM